MTEPRESGESEDGAAILRDQLADLVRRSLVQIGDMKALEEEMVKLSQRISGLTPPPDPKRKPPE
jgi:hypothetical protein